MLVANMALQLQLYIEEEPKTCIEKNKSKNISLV